MQSKLIPEKLPGTVVAQWVKCGTRGCHCARGELHGLYWYRFWRDNSGKVRKEYVRLADLEAMRAACAARQEEERAARGMLMRGQAAVKWYEEKRDKLPVTVWDFEEALRWPQDVRDLVAVACKEDVPLGFRIQGIGLMGRLAAAMWDEDEQRRNRDRNIALLFSSRPLGRVGRQCGLASMAESAAVTPPVDGG